MSEKFEYPLTPEQLYMYERQKEFPDSTMFNIYPVLLKLKDWVDMKKMSASIIKTAQAHPACFSVIEEHNGVPFQKYIPDLITDVKIEKISDAEFQSMINTLVQPFKPDEAPFRFRLFETEKAKYFFHDAYHVMCDAISKTLWGFDLDKVYAGGELKRDEWFSYLEERERAKNLPHYEESRLYYENLYGNTDWSKYPKTDFSDEGENKQGLFYRDIELQDDELDMIANYGLTYNEFFSIISLLSTAMFNNSENVINSWTYKGRWKKSHRNIVGSMIMDMPLALKLKNMTVSQIFASVRGQVKGSLLHRDYSYTILDEKSSEDDWLCILYQGELYDVPSQINLFDCMLEINNGSRGGGGSENIIDIDFRATEEGIRMLFDYAAHKYKPETIEKFSDVFMECFCKIIKIMRENKCDSEVLF